MIADIFVFGEGVPQNFGHCVPFGFVAQNRQHRFFSVGKGAVILEVNVSVRNKFGEYAVHIYMVKTFGGEILVKGRQLRKRNIGQPVWQYFDFIFGCVVGNKRGRCGYNAVCGFNFVRFVRLLSG